MNGEKLSRQEKAEIFLKEFVNPNDAKEGYLLALKKFRRGETLNTKEMERFLIIGKYIDFSRKYIFNEGD